MKSDRLIEGLVDEQSKGFVSGSSVNKQEYANSSLSTSEVAENYKKDPQRFYNDRQPNLAILSEKPEHRVIIYLKAQGLSNREVAEKLGYTEPWISQITRQPWARARMAEEIRLAGRDAVASVIEAAALDSVFKLIEIRDTAQAPSVQLNAANSLLDRFLGKPTQKVESTSTTTNIPVDVDQLQKELEATTAELKRLGLQPMGVN